MRKSPLVLRFSCALLLGVATFQAAARAEELAVEGERVTLSMLLPALSGSELGRLDIAAAPLPGAHTVIRASDIKAKLKEVGRDARGLAIPRSVRVVRRARSLEARELEDEVRRALAVQVAPCEITEVSKLPKLRLGEGEFLLEAEPMPRKQSGRTTFAIDVRQGERSQHISAQAVLACPAPVVLPGTQVRIVAISGPVRVTAPGVATQPGRVGDEIRVTNQLSKRSLTARVIDAQSVEVVQ